MKLAKKSKVIEVVVQSTTRLRKYRISRHPREGENPVCCCSWIPACAGMTNIGLIGIFLKEAGGCMRFPLRKSSSREGRNDHK